MKKQDEEIFCNNIRVLRRQHKLKKEEMARILLLQNVLLKHNLLNMAC